MSESMRTHMPPSKMPTSECDYPTNSYNDSHKQSYKRFAKKIRSAFRPSSNPSPKTPISFLSSKASIGAAACSNKESKNVCLIWSAAGECTGAAGKYVLSQCCAACQVKRAAHAVDQSSSHAELAVCVQAATRRGLTIRTCPRTCLYTCSFTRLHK